MNWPPRPAVAPAPDAAAPQQQPNLRAVLLAGSDSQVIFGDQTLRLGQTANGYRLLEVRERGAVFDLAGRRIEIGLRSTVQP